MLRLRVSSALALAAMLAACNSLTPSTRINVSYDDGQGKTIVVAYESAKEFASPNFELVRDPETHLVTSIRISAEGSTSTGVIGANTEFVTALGQGIAAGLGTIAGAAAKGALGGISYSDQARYTPAAVEGWQKLRAL